MKLVAVADVAATHRLRILRALADEVDDWAAAREMEACVRAVSQSRTAYNDKVQQVVFNLRATPALRRHGAAIVLMTDAAMASGTLIEEVERESHERRLRLEQIIQEKYDELDKHSFRTTLKCRRCGSADIAWEQKQTRGADEAMTVFCTCNKCRNRWTMR